MPAPGIRLASLVADPRYAIGCLLSGRVRLAALI